MLRDTNQIVNHGPTHWHMIYISWYQDAWFIYDIWTPRERKAVMIYD